MSSVIKMSNQSGRIHPYLLSSEMLWEIPQNITLMKSLEYFKKRHCTSMLNITIGLILTCHGSGIIQLFRICGNNIFKNYWPYPTERTKQMGRSLARSPDKEIWQGLWWKNCHPAHRESQGDLPLTPASGLCGLEPIAWPLWASAKWGNWAGRSQRYLPFLSHMITLLDKWEKLRKIQLWGCLFSWIMSCSLAVESQTLNLVVH